MPGSSSGNCRSPMSIIIGGLSPSVSIQQKTAGRNPRSTVGTITESHDFLRVLYARLGQGHCPKCGRPITAQTREQIIGRILALPEGTRFLVLAPVVRGQKGEFKDLFADMVKRGYVRARVDGQVVKLTDDLKLDKRIKHNIEIVIDRLKADAEAARSRLAEAVEQALSLADGNLIVVGGGRRGERRRQPDGERGRTVGLTPRRSPKTSSSPPTTPARTATSATSRRRRSCSASTARTACAPSATASAAKFTFDPDLLIPDPTLSFHDGAIPLVGPLKGMGRWRKHIFEGVGKSLGIDLKTPWNKLPAGASRLTALRQRRRAHRLGVEAARRQGVEARRQVGGDRPAVALAVQEDGGRPAADATRKVHAGGPLPGVRRPAAQPAGPGRPRRRQDARRSSATCPSATSCRGSTAVRARR